ncbi:MAG: hypothetical protein DRI94_07225 [Bacteroidetes bacterium]|nr:MAG: hypothetical protein DRI94_07225 [Bacteroidota bacterium]
MDHFNLQEINITLSIAIICKFKSLFKFEEKNHVRHTSVTNYRDYCSRTYLVGFCFCYPVLFMKILNLISILLLSKYFVKKTISKIWG